MRIFGRDFTRPEVPVVDHGETMNIEKAVEAGHPPVVVVKHPVDDSSEVFTPDAQNGVKNIEAITTVWTKKHLIAAYIM